VPIDFDSIQNLSPELQRIFRTSVRAETKPLETMVERKDQADSRLKLLNDVIGKVNQARELIPQLNTPLAIRDLTLNSSNVNVATGTADKMEAEMGEHTLEVLQLASNASALSNRFEDKDKTRIGTGYFTFTTPSGDSQEVFIDNENGTLEGVARVINSAGAGVKASVVNDVTEQGTKYRLLLKAEGTGAGNDVEFPEFYFIDGDEDFYIEDERPSQNAKLKYQGFEIETPTNEVKELIKGVSLNLKGMSDAGKPIGIDITQDIPKTKEKVKDLVDKLNAVFGFIQTQNKIDEKTDTSKTLGGDYGIRMAEVRLRDTIQNYNLGSPFRSKVRILSDVGIEFKKDGMLKFDEKKFENAINTNYDEVIDLLAGGMIDGGSKGFVPRLGDVLTSIVSPGNGLLANQRDTYTRKISTMNQDIEKKEKDIEKKAEDLKGKLAKLQGAFSKMQGQSGMLGGGGGGMMMPPPGGGGGGGAG
jgi:flagellar hook-associated protein 2